ncbi:MAG TPA: hypothetical protein VGJ13_20050, partial [Pseudonocardiaceae bacterium]
MVRGVVAGAVLAAFAVLTGCGGANPAQPATSPAPAAQDRLHGAGSVDPALVPALSGAQPRAAGEPHALARQITAAETAVRNPASPPPLVTAGGWTAQVAYRALIERPDWDGPVL